jgi:hypothetical protein
MEFERTISGMIGKGSITHNERKFIAENVDGNRTMRNLILVSDDLKTVYHELFDEALERYNVKQKRKDRMIDNYYEHIRTGKQEKLFHEVIFQIGNKDDTGCFSQCGGLARLALIDYAKEFQERNPQFRVFGCYLHVDESTPHLHIDFVPYITGSKRGLDTRVSMKQALASRGFSSRGKSDTEYNQWIESEKEALAEVAARYDIEWKHENTHREHLSVLDFKKEMRAKEVEELTQEVSHLETESEELVGKIAESRADIKVLQEDREEAEKVTRQAKERAEQAQKEAEASEKNLEILRPIMDSVRKEVKQFNGKIDTQLPPAGKFEGASSYRKKILPLFVEMKNKIAALGAELYQVMQELGQMKQRCATLKNEKKALQEENAQLLENYEELHDKFRALADRSVMLDRVERALGKEKVAEIIEKDKAGDHDRLMESIRRKMLGTAEHNEVSPKKKTKSRGMER